MNENPQTQYLEIPVGKIGESYGRFRLIHPRSEASMVKSVSRFGQLTPVVVSFAGKDRYEMIDGFKRLRACRHLNLDYVSARLLDGHGRVLKTAMVQLNRKARSMGNMEEALVVQSLHREDGLSQVEIGSLLGRDKSWVSRRIALVERLSENVLEHLRLGLISSTHGRELSRLPRGNQEGALASVHKHRLSSRETRRLVSMLIEHPRWEHDAILRLSLDILDDRQPPRPRSAASKPSGGLFQTVIFNLERSCNVVAQGLDEGLFADLTEQARLQASSVVQTLEKTLNGLRILQRQGEP